MLDVLTWAPKIWVRAGGPCREGGASPPAPPQGAAAAGAVLLAGALWLAGTLAAAPDPGRLEVHRVAPGGDPWPVLATLPGAGVSLARRMVAYRRLVGPLDAPAALRRVPGVGGRRLHAWSPWILQEGPSP